MAEAFGIDPDRALGQRTGVRRGRTREGIEAEGTRFMGLPGYSVEEGARCVDGHGLFVTRLTGSLTLELEGYEK